jgi:hypothetical protein
MARVYADRVKDTSQTTGTGSLTLDGSPPGGMQSAAAGVGVGNTSDWCAVDTSSGAWEVFEGTLSDATTLTRGALLSSSTGSRVSFAAGEKEVFCVSPAFEVQARTLRVVPVTGTTHIPAVAEAGSYFRCTHASGCTVTIPPESTHPFRIGTTLTYEQGVAAGLGFDEGSGVTINVAATHEPATVDQYAVVQIVKVAADTWTLFGNLEPS